MHVGAHWYRAMVRVADFLRMSGPPEPHNVLQEQGLLHQWYPGMFVIFVSHQWLSSGHPDPQGKQVEVLQKALRGIIDGSLQVTEDIVSRSDDKSLSSDTRRHIADGFLFFDWFSIPQITARQNGVNEDTTKSDAALAVQSIPAYVELSNVFLAVVPELVHEDSTELVNYATWLSRGWCRAELWCRLLSSKADNSVIVVYSATESEFMFPLDWQNNSIVDGRFTVEADRTTVARLGEVAVESPSSSVLRCNYRFYAALRPKLLKQERKHQDADGFLKYFQFNSVLEAALDDSSMNAVMCAVLSGDTFMLRLLVANGADMNTKLRGLSSLGYYDSQTVLMAATKSRQEPSVLATLIELRADVNARSRTGLSALAMARTPGHVKVLLENGAEAPPRVLSGVASFACPETVKVLLSYRCEPTFDPESGSSGPLHAVALLSRGNIKAIETAELLLAHRADVNACARPVNDLLWICRQARLRTAFYGFANCNMTTRLWASFAGITPLGYAAMVGHEQLTKLFLKYGAESFPNERGDTPEDLARNNHHYHLIPLLATFST
ncbi:unnamed protein product [Symbiodinium pilosum]|uniref:Uncharacterized protein n=1 Tax=Symbiodinium pilosum TaxID=2952 RepID=A0A812MIB1_SYMPI|nr:unnamed protein product [Symbiodinium pilosum]